MKNVCCTKGNTGVPCITANWTDLGAGPMTIQTSTTACLVQIADADPTSSKVGVSLPPGRSSIPAPRIFGYLVQAMLWLENNMPGMLKDQPFPCHSF
jgi:hypothetical protein